VKMLGYESVENFMQLTIEEIYADQSEREKFWDELQIAGKVMARELRMKMKDGTFISVAITAMIVTEQSREHDWVDALVEDVTQSRMADRRLQETMDELKEFNELAIGREFRVVELKQEINELAVVAGMEPRYDTSSDEPSCGENIETGEEICSEPQHAEVAR
jgi:PAS domain-containing protein